MLRLCLMHFFVCNGWHRTSPSKKTEIHKQGCMINWCFLNNSIKFDFKRSSLNSVFTEEPERFYSCSMNETTGFYKLFFSKNCRFFSTFFSIHQTSATISILTSLFLTSAPPPTSLFSFLFFQFSLVVVILASQ